MSEVNPQSNSTSSKDGNQIDTATSDSTLTTMGPNDRIGERKGSVELNADEAKDSMSELDVSKQRQIELEEEKKLKARHPCIQRPGSEFLQKRLQRGQKYFDSGDYNMAKAASANPNVKLAASGITPMPAIDSKILNKRH